MGLLQVVKENVFSQQRPRAGHWPAVKWNDWSNFLARIWWCAFPFNTSHMCFTWIWKLLFSIHVVWHMETFYADCWRPRTRPSVISCPEFSLPRMLNAGQGKQRFWVREYTYLVPMLFGQRVSSRRDSIECHFLRKRVVPVDYYACNQSITLNSIIPDIVNLLTMSQIISGRSPAD